MLNAGQPVNLVYRDPAVFDFDAYLEVSAADTLDEQAVDQY
jgi:hypothetical protein